MLSLCARDIMTRDVVTIHKNATVDSALRLMARHNVSGLPVVDTDGCLQGMITESDVLLKGQSQAPQREKTPNGIFTPAPDGVVEAYRRAKSELVEEAMTRRVVVFQEESRVVDIARAMIEHAINRVPIVRDCKVVGIVSRGDVVRALAGESEALGGRDPQDLQPARVIEL